MRRRLLAALAGLSALLASGAAADPALERSLDAALASRALRGARIGALVIRLDSGEVLYAREPDRPLVPASNQKVLTAVAALAAFGPSHRFTTQVSADAPIDAAGGVDRLALRGGGDASLTSEALWRLAADLRRLGLRSVRRGLLLDGSAFDERRWHPSWPGVSARAYHAPVGSLSVNYGTFAVAVSPGARTGEAVRAELDPPVGFLRLSLRATTGPPRARRRLDVQRLAEAGFDTVEVSGVAPAGGDTAVLYRSVSDPLRYAGAVLRLQLEANGIAVGGDTVLGPVPESAVSLLAFEGRPLAEIVRLLLKFSNNSIGETLVKSLGARAAGAPGSWENGIPALRAELAGLGLDTQGLAIVDGSGLSYDNRLSPRLLVGALRVAAGSFRFGPELAAALPIAGADGTLEDRAEASAQAVRAKTGLLTRVTGLSGYARRADGSDVVFSILVNGFRVSADRAMAAVDAFVAALVL